MAKQTSLLQAPTPQCPGEGTHCDPAEAPTQLFNISVVVVAVTVVPVFDEVVTVVSVTVVVVVVVDDDDEVLDLTPFVVCS